MSPLARMRVRAALAGLSGLVGAALFASDVHIGGNKAVLIPIVALVMAAVAGQVLQLGAQLLARGFWWSNLVLGFLLCILGSGHELSPGVGLVIACGAALLIADRRALLATAEAANYRPSAYAGTLQLVMVLALADAQTLGLFSAIMLRDHATDTAGVVFACAAAALVLGFVGLYRLALWGVLLTMGTALALAVAMITGLVRPEREITTPVLVLCAGQVAVPLPMLLSMVTRRPLPSLSPRVRSALGSAGVVVAVAIGIGVALSRR